MTVSLIALIEKTNPVGEDLAARWGKAAVMTVTGEADSAGLSARFEPKAR